MPMTGLGRVLPLGASVSSSIKWGHGVPPTHGFVASIRKSQTCETLGTAFHRLTAHGLS